MSRIAGRRARHRRCRPWVLTAEGPRQGRSGRGGSRQQRPPLPGARRADPGVAEVARLL